VRRACALAALLVALPAWGQSPPAPESITREQAAEILKELRAIRELLQIQIQTQAQNRVPTPVAPQPEKPVAIASLGGYMLGRVDAPLTMVEYSDLQCPFCSRFTSSAFVEIKKNWIDTGKLRYFVRDFPLDIHPLAQRASLAARCAGEQGKFWEVRTALLGKASSLSLEMLSKPTPDTGLETKAYSECMSSTRHEAAIAAETAEGASLGVSATPSFLIGKSAGRGVSGTLVIGADPYDSFNRRLEQLLQPRTP
jgi:protein-disulfide isomerase